MNNYLRLINSIKWRVYRLNWFLFRYKHNTLLKVPSKLSEKEQKACFDKEKNIHSVIQQFGEQTFLEIGIGSDANIERLQLLDELNISYTGVDFKFVCDKHRLRISQSGIKNLKFDFLTNESGTYSWNLMELARNNQKFNMIYLDGHHTLYVDFPALILSHFLLKDGGLLLIDDVTWTLEFMKNVMSRFYNEYYFYRNVYDFDLYTSTQQKTPHIKFISDFFISKFNYVKVDEFSSDDFFVLRKQQ